MPQAAQVFDEVPATRDYSLTGVNSTSAIEKGLAEADWYQCAVPRQTMRKLLQRRDGPAIRDTILWFALILGSGFLTCWLWPHWWAVLPYVVYSVLYASTSDSRWHESGHGTAFKTDWMNNALYEIASFMVMRESTIMRWSHSRHHSDTIIVGRDPEIAVPRPPSLKALGMSFFNLTVYPKYFYRIVLHSLGHMAADEKTYVPETQYPAVYRRARIHVLIYAGVVALAIYQRSLLPLFLVGFTNLFGSWLLVVYGLTQHAGLAENVLDHRLNCRTVYMNPIHRYLYWNMNYHLEHHMFPLVPYHALKDLHFAVKDDCPTPYPSLFAAWREIVPAVLQQVKDPAYHIKRRLPDSRPLRKAPVYRSDAEAGSDGWIAVCAAHQLPAEEVVRFDHAKKTYALYRDQKGRLYATDGMCTHGNNHLSEGLIHGATIECPKHNGRFHLADGSPARAPICRGLATYPVAERGGHLCINILQASGAGARAQKSCGFRVVGNHSVATFIKELVLEPAGGDGAIAFTPGDYLQLDIPPYESIHFRDFDIPEPYAGVWKRQHVFDLVSRNTEIGRRNNYSLASNPQSDRLLRFNVRIATPPPGQDCPPGVGSSYVFSLRPGDLVSGVGPFGDFHIKPTQREMIYIGGGAGMAPLRSHLASLLETQHSSRKISFWYGARSKQEIFYEQYFQNLAAAHHNFTFHLALSAPLPEDEWTGHTGLIHEVVWQQYLRHHTRAQAVEYYLCGPPMMVRACTKMLAALDIPESNIAYDEF